MVLSRTLKGSYGPQTAGRITADTRTASALVKPALRVDESTSLGVGYDMVPSLSVASRLRNASLYPMPMAFTSRERTPQGNMGRRRLVCCCVVVGGLANDRLTKQFTVREARIRMSVHQYGRYLFFGPGVHKVNGYFLRLPEEVSLTEPKIVRGNRAIVTVPWGSWVCVSIGASLCCCLQECTN